MCGKKSQRHCTKRSIWRKPTWHRATFRSSLPIPCRKFFAISSSDCFQLSSSLKALPFMRGIFRYSGSRSLFPLPHTRQRIETCLECARGQADNLLQSSIPATFGNSCPEQGHIARVEILDSRWNEDMTALIFFDFSGVRKAEMIPTYHDVVCNNLGNYCFTCC